LVYFFVFIIENARSKKQNCKSHLVKIAQVLLSVEINGRTNGRKAVGTVPGKGTKMQENGIK